jgi:hypothetical protein
MRDACRAGTIRKQYPEGSVPLKDGNASTLGGRFAHTVFAVMGPVLHETTR